ncbi:hypothetical protein MTBPR1_30034 [Candidatus Terasakiella magnetica]|uniref:Uncharacterized protein n=1 Tax=Candidatus Terasakiella magnetica TaxID=1867952 RepID=A0A1C3RHI7_9PROT|nr:hypothetical protein [Candidatus Terasakiella magnetica]SCA56664.1 hypothetical protein MTBPR1_30034 [Candidatus Terasakiella magnetica]
MFATTQNETSPIHTCKKFHRYVRPVTSLVNLITIIKLFKVEQVLIGEIDRDETTFITVDNERCKSILGVMSSIIQNRGDNVDQYKRMVASLKKRHLYTTVFITEQQDNKVNTLVLAVGPVEDKITYVSVTEDLLLKASSKVQEL